MRPKVRRTREERKENRKKNGEEAARENARKTAKENGVTVYRAEDNVQVLTYADGKVSVKEYDDINEYLSSK